jgi:orotidine-5'-phosphate decarboxylase
VFPLDVHTLGEAERYLDLLAEHVGVFKVGLELFTAVGPAAVHAVHARQRRCFLDLKLHDIPATMAGAVGAAASLGVAYLTLHGSAGGAGLQASVRAAEQSPTKLLAVTVLTSMDAQALAAIGVSAAPADAVLRLARLAKDSGVSGMVCSPLECAVLRDALGPDMELVTPGIRPAGGVAGDQKRIATAASAIAAGANLLVVGRPIREAEDPRAAARAVALEIAQALP